MSDGAIPTNLPPAAAPPQRQDPPLVRNAPVVSAPPQLQAGNAGADNIVLRGRVVTPQPPVDGQITLQTDKGDISIKSSAPLPAGTDVSIELHRDREQMTATLRAARAQQETSAPPPRSDAPTPAPPRDSGQAPPPPATPGDKLVAIVLSGSVEPPPAPPPPSLPTGEALAAVAKQLQEIAQQLVKSGTAGQSGVPSPLLMGLAASKNPAAFLSGLTPDQLQKMLALLPPGSLPQPENAQPLPQGSTATPSTPAPPAPAEQEPPQDSSLLSVLKAATTARLTQQVLQVAPQDNSGGNMMTLLKSLLPLIQSVETGGMATPPQAPAFTQAPAGAELKLLSVQLPQQQTTPMLPATPAPATPLPQGEAPILSGTVIGVTTEGMPVIRTPQADLVLNTRIDLPVGSKLTFEALPLTLADMAARIGDDLIEPLTARSWPALDDALQILAQHAPDAAQALQNSLPAPGPRLVPTALFFMAAIKMGLAENWLGAQSLQVLRDSGNAKTADKLSRDFTRIGDQAGERLPGDWRGISLPLLHDAQLSQIQFFVRRHREDEDGSNGGGETTRFLVNLNLSRLGDMQLDGLLRKLPGQMPGVLEKRLDMVIRSKTGLSPGLMRELQDGYARGLREAQLTGSLEFQAKKDGWVTVGPAARPTQTA